MGLDVRSITNRLALVLALSSDWREKLSTHGKLAGHLRLPSKCNPAS